MRVRRDSTSWVTSLMIFALSFGERVVNHFARRCCLRERKIRRNFKAGGCVDAGRGVNLRRYYGGRRNGRTYHLALSREQN